MRFRLQVINEMLPQYMPRRCILTECFAGTACGRK